MTYPNARRRKRKLKAEINVVPYIDVMLVLLIIFMVTAPLLNLGVDIQLPQSAAKAVQNDKEPILISVDQNGKLFLTLGGAPRESTDADTLIKKVDPRGRDYYWIGGEDPVWESTPGTDFQAVHDGWISVTPLRLDLTDDGAFDGLKGWSLAK